MIPIYNSRLNNDTVKSWQAVINDGSYKTYLVWRMAEMNCTVIQTHDKEQ